MPELDGVYTEAQLNKIIDKLHSFTKEEAEFEKKEADRLLGLKISNAEKLHELQIKLAKDSNDAELKNKQKLNEELLAMGFNINSILNDDDLKKRKANLKAEKQEKIKLAGGNKAEIKKVKAEYKERTLREKDLEKLRKKMQKDANAEAAKAVKEQYKGLGSVIFGRLNGNDAAARAEIRKAHPDWSDSKVNAELRKDKAALAIGAAVSGLSNFAKKLEKQIDEIADAQSEIDTRLQGSNQKTVLGSYWKQMSHDIVTNVSFSPFVKQADVVTNLKTLVGKGIAFNVEQRAFLDTISDKIATTFEATDATLLKLVRIQQADTTAARLGMESALTAFLNNMYETTEYMSQAAESIRASLYEASALMGAVEATAFEYQVQKWMGSLYSVGFSNTSGLAAALGKLAAGDISSINDGGYGNLLIMAANKANLSIAEILADGLDDSETNQLMRAMVEYLGEIYKETKNSKVVAQQFANVYGLTASDLKAAANLAISTRDISRNNLDYSGMITQLNNMADTMYARTSTGAMMTTLFDNLKYGIANSMANNPALYATYTIASMLDDTVGGISIPAIFGFGTGIDLETTVADLLRVGSLAGGLLSGIGSMLGGLGHGGGFSGSGMLRAFGVSSNNVSVTQRGKGLGLLTTTSGADVSYSGYEGNAEGSDVQNKATMDAKDSANEDLNDQIENDNETKLSTVDEHIIDIYDLINSVINGFDAIRVKDVSFER